MESVQVSFYRCLENYKITLQYLGFAVGCRVLWSPFRLILERTLKVYSFPSPWMVNHSSRAVSVLTLQSQNFLIISAGLGRSHWLQWRRNLCSSSCSHTLPAGSLLPLQLGAEILELIPFPTLSPSSSRHPTIPRNKAGIWLL